jgi:tetratricopeptide (TPR) repeat protein
MRANLLDKCAGVLFATVLLLSNSQFCQAYKNQGGKGESTLKRMSFSSTDEKLPASSLQGKWRATRSVESEAMQRAREKINKGNWEGAISDLNEVLKEDPENVAALTWRGYARLKVNDPNYALADLSEALKNDEENTDALTFRGWAKTNLGDVDGGIKDCTAALKRHQNAQAFYIRGKDRSMSNNAVAAVADEDKALKLDPNLADAWEIKGQSRLALGDAAMAISDFSQAISKDPTPRYYLDRGRAYLLCDKYEQALPDLTKAADEMQGSPAPLMFRCLTYLGLKDVPSALKDAQKCVKLTPDSPKAHRVLAYALEDSGDLTGAAAEYNKAAKLYDSGDDHDDMNFCVKRLKGIAANKDATLGTDEK